MGGPAFSGPEWERIGTDEPPDPNEHWESPVAELIPGPEASSAPLEQDPQPFNPNYQRQTGILDWINVQSLGARGDGVTDDLPIFQAANLIALIPPRRVIYIPAGTYFLSQAVALSSGVQYLNMGTITGGPLSGGTALAFGVNSLTNPMTTSQDMIVAGGGGTPGRLAVGSNLQVLTVNNSGIVAWMAEQGLLNPMTTPGDIITGGASGAPQRLGIGGAAQVLGNTAGAVAWVNQAAGFANPMNSVGDMIYSVDGAGTAGRLAIGPANNVLTSIAGIPSWQPAAAGGMTNPMTTTGDLIIGNPGSTPARVGVGAAGQVLGVSGGIPSWVTPATTANLPYIIIFPTNDTSGVMDQANITAAFNTLKNGNPPGGIVWLAPGKFYVKPTSGNLCLSMPGQSTAGTTGGFPVSMQGCGPATVLFPVGAAVTALYYHRSASYGNQYGNPAQQNIGFIRDLVIDGSNATGASIGLDVGDGWGGLVEKVAVVNFTGAGAIGINFIQRVFWCEKWRFITVELINNTTQMYQTTAIPGSDHSHEYNYFDINMFCNQNQQGFVVDGVNMGGSQLFLRGNMCQSTAAAGNPPTGNIAALTIKNTTGQNNAESRWYFGQIWMKVEANRTAQFPDGAGGTNVMPYGVFMDGIAQGIKQCSGHISHSLTDSVINNSEFSFTGMIGGDNNLVKAFPGAPGSGNTVNPGVQPTFPGLGVLQQNYGPDTIVCIAGGTVSGVTINGQATGLTTGPFPLKSGQSITVNGTVAPTTYAWIPTQSSF